MQQTWSSSECLAAALCLAVPGRLTRQRGIAIARQQLALSGATLHRQPGCANQKQQQKPHAAVPGTTFGLPAGPMWSCAPADCWRTYPVPLLLSHPPMAHPQNVLLPKYIPAVKPGWGSPCCYAACQCESALRNTAWWDPASLQAAWNGHVADLELRVPGCCSFCSSARQTHQRERQSHVKTAACLSMSRANTASLAAQTQKQLH